MKIKNPLLQKVQQAQAAKVKPQMQSAFQRIVLAGEKIMYGEQTRQMVSKELRGQGNPADVVGVGVAKLLGILMNQSKGTMPMAAAVPAGTVLLCEALDFVEQAGMLKVTPDLLAQATHTMFASFLQLLGVTQQKLDVLMRKGGQVPQPAAQPAMPPAPPPGLVGQAQGVPA